MQKMPKLSSQIRQITKEWLQLITLEKVSPCCSGDDFLAQTVSVDVTKPKLGLIVLADFFKVE